MSWTSTCFCPRLYTWMSSVARSAQQKMSQVDYKIQSSLKETIKIFNQPTENRLIKLALTLAALVLDFHSELHAPYQLACRALPLPSVFQTRAHICRPSRALRPLIPWHKATSLSPASGWRGIWTLDSSASAKDYLSWICQRVRYRAVGADHTFINWKSEWFHRRFIITDIKNE